MDKVQGKIWDVLCGMDGEAVARLFTSYYGLQILTREFAEHMIDEGASDAYELGIDDEYEEYDDEED